MALDIQFERRIAALERQVPLTFAFAAGTAQPTPDKQEIVFWEDVGHDRAQILMRRGSKIFVFNSFISGTVYGVSSLTPPVGSAIGGDITLAQGTDMVITAVGQTITFGLPSDSAMVHTHNKLKSQVGSGFILTLTDDGVDETLTSSNGKLNLVPATALVVKPSLASGASNYAVEILDQVARSAGGYFRIQDNAANSILDLRAPTSGAGSACFTISFPANAAYGTVLQFSGTASTTGLVNGVSASVTQAGAGTGVGGVRAVGTFSAALAHVLGAKTHGLSVVAAYGVTSGLGLKANDRLYGGEIINAWVNNSAIVGTTPIGQTWGLMIGNSGTPNPVPTRWAGLLIGAGPGATTQVGLHVVDGLSVPADKKIYFDTSATISPSSAQGSSTFSALTLGDSYGVYNSASTQLDWFVDGAQAAHFDAGGAAGTSKVYGHFQIAGDLLHLGANFGALGAAAQAQQANTADLKDSFCGFGFQVNGGASPLNLDGGKLTCGEVNPTGDLNHDGTNVGFYGVAPVARSAAYTPTNVTTDRSYDANSTTIDELADVLGTLIADLQATGIVG